MMTIKSEADFAAMRRAGRIVARIHEALRDAASPGVSLLDLDAIAARIVRDGKTTSNFLGYHGFPAVTCLSVNEEIVHGIPSARRLEEGDILSVDAGAVYEGWHADGAITFPVGAVPEETSRLLAVTEKAMWAGIEAATIGTRIGDLGAVIGAVAEEAGYGIVRDYTGHGIGRAMHEEPQIPNFGRPGTGMRLRRGMAVCLEPMFNLGGDDTRVLEDGWTVVTADGSLSAHFEHTVAITPDGPQVLTLA
ncbi:MAG: type I methionyl aminopeptidase [Acidimicrobiia bacterium]|nr:MAG: type I methionyl aminopeptidase [Acidimicrobiia bacterium]